MCKHSTSTAPPLSAYAFVCRSCKIPHSVAKACEKESRSEKKETNKKRQRARDCFRSIPSRATIRKEKEGKKIIAVTRSFVFETRRFYRAAKACLGLEPPAALATHYFDNLRRRPSSQFGRPVIYFLCPLFSLSVSYPRFSSLLLSTINAISKTIPITGSRIRYPGQRRDRLFFPARLPLFFLSFPSVPLCFPIRRLTYWLDKSHLIGPPQAPFLLPWGNPMDPSTLPQP